MKRVLCLFLILITLMTGCTSSHTVQRESPEQLEYPSEQEQSKQEDQSEEPNKYNTMISPKGELSIVRKPEVADYTIFRPGKMVELPKYNPQSSEMWQVDLRSSDLTNLNLRENFEDLIYAHFDSKTKWPDKLPDGFNHELIMELGKNPGLGLRELHEKGITGKGIGIAIIDQALLVDHVEYKDQLKLYEEIHYINETRSIHGPIASMHGPAVASIAVGKTVGVAPEANLYFIAETHGVYNEKREFEWDLTWLAKSIDRIVEINNILLEGEKIRVISISLGIEEWMNGYEKVVESIKKAKQEDIYTIYVGSDPFGGLGRDPSKNPDDSASYLKGEFWKAYKYNNDNLLVPMDSRCTASPSGNNDYVFYRQGGMSWAVPYVAGLYALACQINPSITPEVFWRTALNTGEIISLSNGDKLGNIVNSARLIEKIEKLK
jgi:hypothetical protein